MVPKWKKKTLLHMMKVSKNIKRKRKKKMTKRKKKEKQKKLVIKCSERKRNGMFVLQMLIVHQQEVMKQVLVLCKKDQKVTFMSVLVLQDMSETTVIKQ